MEKILVIIKREYLARVRTRAFLIGTIATPVLMLGLTLLPILISPTAGDRHITVLDQSSDPGLYESVKKGLGSQNTDAKVDLTHEILPPSEDVDEVLKKRLDSIKDTDVALLVLRRGILDGTDPEYYARNVSELSTAGFGRAISGAITERRLVRAGLNQDQVAQYIKPVELKSKKVGAHGETEDGRPTFVIAFVMLFFIYITILLYGVSVMRGVIEEKQSRIVEVIVSSVRPFQLMLGKLIGIGLVGLTQYLIWVASFILLSVFGVSLIARSGFKMPSLPPILYVSFVVYFVLGYFLFATLYAVVGSMVSSEDEAQQASMPVTMLIVIPMLIFNVVLRDPSSTAAVALSMVPFFAPTLMMMRIAILTPPLWQILASMLIMLITILAVVWLAARIYRVGILMYGKRPNLAELGRWLRYS
jgi:ABC-2 type transport system permease protein